MKTDHPTLLPGAGSGLESRVTTLGKDLQDSLGSLLADLPQANEGPQRLATSLGLDKVFTSRLLKALRSKDPIAMVHHAPGPDPLRRFLRAVKKRGGAVETLRKASDAVDRLDTLIRREAGDRGALDAMLAGWLPAAREEFELRRKQAAHRALSLLYGSTAEVNLATVLLHPSRDGKRLDIVWVIGLLGLRRLRQDARVKLATRRITSHDDDRQPRSLGGEGVQISDGLETSGMDGMRLDQFCHNNPAQVSVSRVGATVHYVLGDSGFGPKSAVDFLFAEVNLEEMAHHVPVGSGRRGYVFSEVGVPARRALLDVFVHRDAYPGRDPQLVIYDTAFEGVADVNDRSRDVDRLDLLEHIQPLGYGLGQVRAAFVPDYRRLLGHVHDSLGWNADEFRGYRCAIDYPLYGSQVCMVFEPPVA